MKTSFLVAAAALAFLAGCSSTKPASSSAPAQSASAQPAPAKPAAPVENPITGTPRPGSKFANLKIGMDMQQVQIAMGSAPTRTDSHETGKRWIPFYFGPDARRLEAWYQGEGCLTFTGGNIWGGAGGELIAINHDATGKCFEQQ